MRLPVQKKNCSCKFFFVFVDNGAARRARAKVKVVPQVIHHKNWIKCSFLFARVPAHDNPARGVFKELQRPIRSMSSLVWTPSSLHKPAGVDLPPARSGIPHLKIKRCESFSLFKIIAWHDEQWQIEVTNSFEIDQCSKLGFRLHQPDANCVAVSDNTPCWEALFV